MLNNPSPLPLKNPLPDGMFIFPLTNNEPVNVEPLANDCTLNPVLGDTDAVTLPLAILNESSVIAERGISNKPLPEPEYIDAVIVVLTTNPKFGEIDAVAEPDAILFNLKDNADSGISNNSAPLPLKNPDPLGILTLPLSFKLPVNWEPLCNDSTLNPKSGVTDAVTLPLAILNASPLKAERGILNNPPPSPTNEPDMEAVICCALREPVISTLPLILSEPVICCISNISSPNLFEPDEYITEEEI